MRSYYILIVFLFTNIIFAQDISPIGKLKANVVRTANLVDGAVDSSKIKENAITTSKIATSAWDTIRYKIDLSDYTTSGADSVLISQGLYNIVKDKAWIPITAWVANDCTLNQGDELNIALKYCADNNYVAYVPPGKYHLQAGYHFSMYPGQVIVSNPKNSIFYSEGTGFIVDRNFGGITADSLSNNYYVYGLHIKGIYPFNVGWAGGNAGIYISSSNPNNFPSEFVNQAIIEKCIVEGIRSESIKIVGARDAQVLYNIVRNTPFSAYTMVNDNLIMIGNTCEDVVYASETDFSNVWKDHTYPSKAIIKNNIFNIGSNYGLRINTSGIYEIEGNIFSGSDTLLNWSGSNYAGNGIEMVSTNSVFRKDTSYTSIVNIKNNTFTHLSNGIKYYTPGLIHKYHYVNIQGNHFTRNRINAIGMNSNGTTDAKINYLNISENVFSNWSSDISGSSSYSSGVAIYIKDQDTVIVKNNTFNNDSYSNGRNDPLYAISVNNFIYSNNIHTGAVGAVNIDSVMWADSREKIFIYNNTGLGAAGVRIINNGTSPVSIQKTTYQGFNALYNGLQIGLLKIIINESVANDSTYFIIGTDSINASTVFGF